MQMHEGKLFTNSCVELSIPFEYQQSANISCTWSSLPSKHHSCALAEYLTYQPRHSNDIDRSYYICSPLDFANFVHVKIQQQGITENAVLEQFRYGPVEIQNDLFNSVQPSQWNKAEIVLNKSTRKQASVFVSSQINSENFQKQIKIALRVESLQFCISIDEGTAEQERLAFQKTSFFQLYDSQPSTVGILISRQMLQLMEKMKQIFTVAHFGNYIKLCFDNRVCRDIFILSLMAQTALGFERLKSFSAQLEAKKLNKNSGSPDIRANPGALTSGSINGNKELMRVPKIQSTIRTSQIVGFEFLSATDNDTEQPETENIIEDIYNILYTPVNKTEKGGYHQAGNNFISDNNVLENSIEINECEAEAERRQAESLVGPNRSSVVQSQIKLNAINGNFSRSHNVKTLNASSSVIRKHKTLNVHADGYLTTHSLKTFPDCNQMPDKNIFYQELKQIDLLEKINELVKVNERLQRENKLLKEQNSKLKKPVNGFHRSSDHNKMIQIKEMVQLMAIKLANLESREIGRNALPIPKHQPGIASENRHVTRRQHKEVKQQHSNKRFWSPKAHEELVRTMKYKEIEKKTQLKTKREEIESKKFDHYFRQASTNSCQQCIGSNKCERLECKCGIQFVNKETQEFLRTGQGNPRLTNSYSPFRNVFGST